MESKRVERDGNYAVLTVLFTFTDSNYPNTIVSLLTDFRACLARLSEATPIPTLRLRRIILHYPALSCIIRNCPKPQLCLRRVSQK